ncbi:reverse transcriptase [Senna tora]|uniref:Reverse transcriptase n=1 Tax=Senna tora TaxID=362788 RepID=A0A834TTQ6_9FABA|nr:reverse transcriptase [Senna tora]
MIAKINVSETHIGEKAFILNMDISSIKDSLAKHSFVAFEYLQIREIAKSEIVHEIGEKRLYNGEDASPHSTPNLSSPDNSLENICKDVEPIRPGAYEKAPSYRPTPREAQTTDLLSREVRVSPKISPAHPAKGLLLLSPNSTATRLVPLERESGITDSISLADLGKSDGGNVLSSPMVPKLDKAGDGGNLDTIECSGTTSSKEIIDFSQLLTMANLHTAQFQHTLKGKLAEGELLFATTLVQVRDACITTSLEIDYGTLKYSYLLTSHMSMIPEQLPNYSYDEYSVYDSIQYFDSVSHNYTTTVGSNMNPINILIWNARCTAIVEFRGVFVDLKNRHKPSVVFISATRIGGNHATQIISNMGFCGFYRVDPMGYSPSSSQLREEEDQALPENERSTRESSKATAMLPELPLAFIFTSCLPSFRWSHDLRQQDASPQREELRGNMKHPILSPSPSNPAS